MDREALGFQALGSYESYLEDNLPDSSFYADIITSLDKGTQPFVVCDG